MLHDFFKKKVLHEKVKKYIKKNEKIFNEVKYLFIPKKSDILLIVFSGFTGETRKYNYVSSFYHLNVNQLYVLDVWGYLGSYYWLQHGSDNPEQLVSLLIQTIIKEYSIKTLITCGSSKGGTAAIYFGLKHEADIIYSGACQFYVGSYLNRQDHIKIFDEMIGNLDKNRITKELDEKLSKEIEKHASSKAIHLFYSTKELTYERQIIPLKECLDRNSVEYDEEIVDFDDHAEVGRYFPIFVCEKLENYLNAKGK